jgi:hypothetical protein
MRGSAVPFDLDDDDLKAMLPKPKMASERVEALVDDSIPSVDLSSAEPAAAPAPAAPAASPAPAVEKTAALPQRAKDAGFFAGSFATPVELDRALIEKYGVDWLEWEPETIWTTITADFGTPISDASREKINAAKLLHVSDSFWRHWEVFEKVVLAFNGIKPLFDRVQDITLGQMLHAVLQASEIRKEHFEQEVLSYIAMRCKEEGFIWLPAPLDVAQETLDGLNPPEIVPLKREIQERWEAMADADWSKVELKEDVYGVHLAKLAAADRYLNAISSPETAEDI